MTTNNVLQLIDVNCKSMDKSPSRKRARYQSPVNERRSLTQRNTLLDEVYDYGLNLLAGSESHCGSEEDKDCDNLGHFQELSDEMILYIFHYLPKRILVKAALVCKRWHSITQDKSLWARMDLSCHHLRPGSLGYVLSRQVMIMQLAQADILYPPVVPGCYAYNEDFRSRLLLLNLSMVNASCDTLVAILKRCHRLEKISLERVIINEEVLAALSSSKDIEVVNLALVKGINERGLRHLLGNCLSIRELNLAWTHLNTASIQYVCSNVPKCLDRLNMCGCKELLNNKHIMELVSRCGKLRELNIHDDCTSLTNEAIVHITLLKDLNFLALSLSYHLSYNSLLQLKNIPSLLYLDVYNGYDQNELRHVQDSVGCNVQINRFKFSSVARPNDGIRRSSIWNMRVSDYDDSQQRCV